MVFLHCWGSHSEQVLTPPTLFPNKSGLLSVVTLCLGFSMQGTGAPREMTDCGHGVANKLFLEYLIMPGSEVIKTTMLEL